ncbi:MAG TPA: ATP-binding protein [Usitatibacter sp.]|nr:ATP-binding protein [Usitatibacter sp.]
MPHGGCVASSFPRNPHPAARSPAEPLGRGPLEPIAANEERFRHLVEATPALAWSADADGKVTYANKRLFDYIGLPADGNVEDWARAALHPEDYPRREAAWHKAREDSGAFELEARIRRHDGAYRWFLLRVLPLKNASEQVVEWFGSGTDIDQRKRSEENLRFLAHASAALAQIADPADTLKRIAQLAVPHFADWSEVTVIDPDGARRRLVATHWDPRRARFLDEIERRFPSGEGSASTRVIRGGEAIFASEVSDEMLRQAARSPEHLEMIRKLGLRSYICVPMSASGRIAGSISFATAESGRTYTEFDLETAAELARRAGIALENAELVQALKDADRRKDEFLAVLAHELRNPLAPVRNAIEILRATPAATAQQQWTQDVIDRQVRQLSRLVDDLLDVSRITSGKIELRKERVELGAAVRIALESSRPLIERGGHELSVTLPAEPIRLDADLARLAQVLSNLLNNAAKYTRPGGHIWLTAERSGSHAVVRVRDNGIGIRPAMLTRIFDMFTQVAGSGPHSQGGLGIGLTLVRRLVELHGGSVEARSEGIGKGSEFTVTLPLAGSETANGEEAADSHPGDDPHPRRILVVDDNRDAADSLCMLLKSRGHEVRVAYDGLEAVGSAVAFHPDVVLLDIGLPKLSGYEAARRIREAGGAQALLIAVTGWGQEEDRRRARDAGFDHHLTKPVDPAAISWLIERSGTTR